MINDSKAIFIFLIIMIVYMFIRNLFISTFDIIGVAWISWKVTSNVSTFYQEPKLLVISLNQWMMTCHFLNQNKYQRIRGLDSRFVNQANVKELLPNTNQFESLKDGICLVVFILEANQGGKYNLRVKIKWYLLIICLFDIAMNYVLAPIQPTIRPWITDK